MRSSTHARRHRSLIAATSGFTMVELIVVMVLVAILAVSAVPMFGAIYAAREAGWREQLSATLRQAQSLAFSHRRLVCAKIDSTGVSLLIASSFGVSTCTTLLSLAAPNTNAVATTYSSGMTQLYFQPNGRITTDAAGTAPASGTMTFSTCAPITVVGTVGVVR